jgi:dTDP-4-amino-4,6-dideoxygalactose transaminase
MPERIYNEREIELLKQVLASKNLGSLNGKFTPEFERLFAEKIGVKYAIAMNSGMSALHAAVMCAGGAGSEVICDSLFIFGALAALYNNAIPKFVDIDPVTHTMDPEKIEGAINERTKAIIVTHAWGLPADMDRINKIAKKYNIVVIEDCAHAILAKYRDKYTGNLGDIGCFSFQASKQLSLGDGGMATTNNEEISKNLDLHAGAPTFFSIAHGLHYNYRMNELTAAVGIAQLEKIADFVGGLQKIASYYDMAIENCKWIIPQKAPDRIHTYHYWAATFDGEKYGLSLEEFKEELKKEKIGISVGYTNMPSYKHPVIRDKLAHAFHCKNYPFKVEYPDGLCPVAEKVIPSILLAYTVKTEEQAKYDSEKLFNLIKKLEK